MMMEVDRIEKITDPETKKPLFKFYFVPMPGAEKPKKSGDWTCTGSAAISDNPTAFVAGQVYDVSITAK